MTKSRISLTVALVAAVVSACSPASEKPWPTRTPDTGIATGHRWLDVTGQGREAPRDEREHVQYGGDPVPGIKMLHVINANDEMDMCTVGPAVAGPRSRGFLTVGRCMTHNPLQYLQTAPAGGITPWAPATDPGPGPGPGVDTTAVVWSDRRMGEATRIAGTWPVSGLFTVDGAQKMVPVDSPVCLDGARSGVVCGRRLPDRSGVFTFDAASKSGDTGSPVFTVDSLTRTAVLIGILDEKANSSARGVVFADTPLARLNARALLDPSATPLQGEGFSSQVTAGP